MTRTHILAQPMRRRKGCYAVSLDAMTVVCRMVRAEKAARFLRDEREWMAQGGEQ